MRAAALCAAAAAAAGGEVPATMRAAEAEGRCTTPDFACVTTRTVPTPSPGPGHVLIEVRGSGVNPCDRYFLQNGIQLVPGALGMDAAGVVAAVGDGCSRLKVGDEVWACSFGGSAAARAPKDEGVTGAMAQYMVATEEMTGAKPASINFTEAGTIPLAGFTSLQCLQAAAAPWEPGANATVVVTSGTGGTGFLGVQLAKALGAATVVTAASGAENIAYAHSIGADVVVDYMQRDIFDALPDDSVDAVYDNYGAKGTADRAMPKIRAGGTYVYLPGGGGGGLSRHPKKGVTQVNFGVLNASSHTGLDTLRDLFDAGKLRPRVQQVFPLEAAAAAFALNAGGQVVGKVAVTP